MAYRIHVNGTIEADSPAEVAALFGLVGVPFLGSTVTEIAPASRQLAAAPEEVVVPRRGPSKKRAGGGVAKKKAVASSPARPSKQQDRQARLLRALLAGSQRTSDIAASIAATVFVTRTALQAAAGDGLVSAEGATLSRRWSLTPKGQRAVGSPKEAVR
jgi:hypothetical protein